MPNFGSNPKWLNWNFDTCKNSDNFCLMVYEPTALAVSTTKAQRLQKTRTVYWMHWAYYPTLKLYERQPLWNHIYRSFISKIYFDSESSRFYMGCNYLSMPWRQWQFNQTAWTSCQIRKIAGCACTGNVGNIFPRNRLQRKLLVSEPGMHHGTCVTHVPWCMSGSLTRGGWENVTGIPGACAPAILRIW